MYICGDPAGQTEGLKHCYITFSYILMKQGQIFHDRRPEFFFFTPFHNKRNLGCHWRLTVTKGWFSFKKSKININTVLFGIFRCPFDEIEDLSERRAMQRSIMQFATLDWSSLRRAQQHPLEEQSSTAATILTVKFRKHTLRSNCSFITTISKQSQHKYAVLIHYSGQCVPCFPFLLMGGWRTQWTIQTSDSMPNRLLIPYTRTPALTWISSKISLGVTCP